MSTDQNSPRIFVIDLPEADIARSFCADLINRIFRARKESFNLIPKIVFVFDEAQEFIPQEKRKMITQRLLVGLWKGCLGMVENIICMDG